MTNKDPLISDLKTRRQALGWSLQDVSERCGVDEKFLCDWEHGVGSPRLDAVHRWGEALGVKLALVSAEETRQQGLRIDWEQRRVTVDGTPIRLTTMEWKGLERLARTPGELVDHQTLFRHLYGDDRPYRAESTAIRVLITKLRRLLPLRIDARWGQGYVLTGLPSSPHCAASADNHAAEPLQPKVKPASTESRCHEPKAEAEAGDRLPESGKVLDLSDVAIQRGTAGPSRLNLGRADELGVIERFLAERGATRCPDVSTIQQTPLPTLVWDRVKRKWVRPPATQQAS